MTLSTLPHLSLLDLPVVTQTHGLTLQSCGTVGSLTNHVNAPQLATITGSLQLLSSATSSISFAALTIVSGNINLEVCV